MARHFASYTLLLCASIGALDWMRKPADVETLAVAHAIELRGGGFCEQLTTHPVQCNTCISFTEGIWEKCESFGSLVFCTAQPSGARERLCGTTTPTLCEMKRFEYSNASCTANPSDKGACNRFRNSGSDPETNPGQFCP